ncbi:uncharacterized protein EI90DRAFT_3149824, partial [Cantharellus anzutake]|uniref:uncharacterized protein n=1 Tax=Cantharellus anzutake TaxID=1750568 RepID=UPI001907AAAE
IPLLLSALCSYLPFVSSSSLSPTFHNSAFSSNVAFLRQIHDDASIWHQKRLQPPRPGWLPTHSVFSSDGHVCAPAGRISSRSS